MAYTDLIPAGKTKPIPTDPKRMLVKILAENGVTGSLDFTISSGINAGQKSIKYPYDIIDTSNRKFEFNGEIINFFNNSKIINISEIFIILEAV